MYTLKDNHYSNTNQLLLLKSFFIGSTKKLTLTMKNRNKVNSSLIINTQHNTDSSVSASADQ